MEVDFKEIPVFGGNRKGAAVRYYPLFLDISRRLCVVVGGGNVAERKVERLLACEACVEVVGKRLTPTLAALAREGRIVHHDGDYEGALIRGAFLVIGATDSDTVNGRIAMDARALGIPVNIVDEPARCDFILPSVIRRGDVTIAASTGGASPALARHLREELEAFLSEDYGPLAELLQEVRQELRSRGIVVDSEAWQRAINGPLRALIAQGRRDQARAHLLASLGVEAPNAGAADSEK